MFHNRPTDSVNCKEHICSLQGYSTGCNCNVFSSEVRALCAHPMACYSRSIHATICIVELFPFFKQTQCRIYYLCSLYKSIAYLPHALPTPYMLAYTNKQMERTSVAGANERGEGKARELTVSCGGRA